MTESCGTLGRYPGVPLSLCTEYEHRSSDASMSSDTPSFGVALFFARVVDTRWISFFFLRTASRLSVCERLDKQGVASGTNVRVGFEGMRNRVRNHRLRTRLIDAKPSFC
jgi:hypothetical protein